MQNLAKRKLGNSAISKRYQSLFFSIALAFVSLILAYLIAEKGIAVGLLCIAGIIGIALLAKSLVNIEFGIYTAFAISFFIMGTHRLYDMSNIPIAMVVDAFVFVVIIGIAIKSKNSQGTKSKLTIIDILFLIWVGYHILQLGNPYAPSRIAWFYAVRIPLLIIIFYFVVSYAVKSDKFVSTILKIWIGIVLLAAIYCLKQEYFGLFQFETTWLHQNPKRYNLLVTWGKVRKFSFLEGPMTLGIVLAYTGVLCFTLLSGPFSRKNKIILFISGVIMIWAMMFTGTRTATVLLPVGMVFYALITFKKKVLMGVGIFMFFGTLIVLMPTGNPNLFIMKTAFRGGEDASMNVRLTNQEIIQPFLQSHPFGAGIGSTGGWGAIFSPHTFLGSFPPDSEYLRVAIELGWIGLLYFCLFMFIILKTGIDNYFKTKDLRLKAFYVGILTVTFMTVVAMYPQEAIRIHPTGFIFAVCIALINKMVTIQKESI